LPQRIGRGIAGWKPTKRLLPILAAAGVDPGEPMISQAHNVIAG